MTESTRRTYSVAWTRYQRCCKSEGVSPLPVSEQGLCRFVTVLAVEGLASTSIRSYLAGVRHDQVKARGASEGLEQRKGAGKV